MSARPRIVAERLRVGVELDAAVDDELEVGPDLGDGRLAAQVEDALEEHEQPARHAADQRDRLVEAPLGQQGELAVPVGLEGQLERRKGVGPEQRR